MEFALAIALVAAIGALAFRSFYGRTVFVLEIDDDGRVRTVKGIPPSGYPRACEDVVRLNGLRSGRIRAARRGGQITLRFSRDIPEVARQAFRNTWEPPSPPGGGGARAKR